MTVFHPETHVRLAAQLAHARALDDPEAVHHLRRAAAQLGAPLDELTTDLRHCLRLASGPESAADLLATCVLGV